MGTNYYVEFDRQEGIDFDGKFQVRYRRVHLGKQSLGWKFLFHNAEVDGVKLNSYWQWYDWIRMEDKGRHIWDEYNRPITHEEFFKSVRDLQSLKSHEIGWVTDDEYGFQFAIGEFV